MSSSMDTWDEPNRGPIPVSASGSRSKPATPAVVRDDWEMDEEEEEDNGRSIDERNKQIWEDANTKESHPMPALVISRGSSSLSATPSLPLNQPPTMRILKRPSPSQSPSQSSTNVNSGETFQQREARYQAARERIFGAEGSPDIEDKKKNSSQKSLVSQNPAPNTTATIVREPRGPSSSTSSSQVGSDNKGFGERRAKRPPLPSTEAPLSAAVSISSPNTPA